MDRISIFLDNIYSYEYFGPIIFGVTAFLIVLFFIILFFGKKDEKAEELESTKQLELASLNAFEEKDAAKNLYENANEMDLKAKEEEEIFAKLDNLVSEAKTESMSDNEIEFPSINVNEGNNIENIKREVPEFEFSFDENESKTEVKEEVNDDFNFPGFEDVVVASPIVSDISGEDAIKEELDKTLASPVLEPVTTDDIIISQEENLNPVGSILEQDEEIETEIPDVEVSEVKDKFSSLATSIDEELNNLENMIKENNGVKFTEDTSLEDDNLKSILDSEKEVKEENKPLSSKNIPGAKQIFSSVFVAPKKEEEIPEEYKNNDFEDKFNSLLNNKNEVKEEKKEDIVTEVKEEVKEEPVKTFNFKIKEAPKNKIIDLPKKVDMDLPKLNDESSNEKITKDDFPEFPTLTNELESYRR